jgi:hypothetical protein
VKSGRYDFTGRIQWDNDETLTSDKLDGESGRQRLDRVRRHREHPQSTSAARAGHAALGRRDVPHAAPTT